RSWASRAAVASGSASRARWRSSCSIAAVIAWGVHLRHRGLPHRIRPGPIPPPGGCEKSSAGGVTPGGRAAMSLAERFGLGGRVGVEVHVEGLTKSFGAQPVWSDVSLTLPAGEISVLLGPSGTGKSVFLKTLVGLLKPDRGAIRIGEHDLTRLTERELYE